VQPNHWIIYIKIAFSSLAHGYSVLRPRGFMQLAEAMRMLEVLANGLDPLTGQPLAVDHLCQQPPMVRALSVLVQHLQQTVPSDSSAGTSSQDASISWTAAEEMDLVGPLILLAAGSWMRTAGHSFSSSK
jgi:hypothetical protein